MNLEVLLSQILLTDQMYHHKHMQYSQMCRNITAIAAQCT